MGIHLSSLSSDICIDDLEEGIGASTGLGYQNELISKTFDSLEDMVKYLASMYGLSDDLNNYEQDGYILRTSKTVADHSQAQNGGWMEPTEAELAAYQEGKMKLYSDEYEIRWLEVR